MKRKYFFGILICLVLLCGGVFLLTSNYINDNQINQEVTNASNANFHFNKVYGYNTAGVNFTVGIGKCDAGGNVAELASRSIKYSDSASGKIGKTEDIGGLYDFRQVAAFPYSSKQDGLEYQHNGYYARFSGSLIYDNGDPATSINQNFTSSGFKQTCGPTGWFTGVSLNFEIYWIVRLTLDENEGPSINNNVYYSTYNARLTTSSVTKPTRTGHTFKGYYTDKENGDQWLGLDENGNIIVNTAYLTQSKARPKTLYAHWTANKYTVTLSRNGGSNGTGSVTATYDSAMPNINIPSKGGYKFLGYWDKTSGGTQYYDANGNSVRNWNKASNATLYARWERNNYKIDINFYKPNGSTQNGGTFDLYKQLSGGSETLIQEGLSNEIEGSAYLQYEGKFILKNVLPLTGTTISSVRLSNGNGTLSTSGKTINGKTIIDTITYTASQTGPPNGDGNWDNAIQIYTAYNTLTATLKYQDDATADAKRSTTYNSNRTSLSLPSPTRTGYRFLGWSLTQNDTGVYYTPESDFNDVSINGKTVSDPNVENLSFNLYAIWQPYEYEVVFNKNSNQAVGSMNNQSFTYDIAQNLSTNQFTRAGYNFLGWSRSSNATTAEYQDKVSVKNLITTNNGIVTLYAIWGINQNSLTINLDGGKFETNLINNSYTQSLESYQMTFLETPIP